MPRRRTARANRATLLLAEIRRIGRRRRPGSFVVEALQLLTRSSRTFVSLAVLGLEHATAFPEQCLGLFVPPEHRKAHGEQSAGLSCPRVFGTVGVEQVVVCITKEGFRTVDVASIEREPPQALPHRSDAWVSRGQHSPSDVERATMPVSPEAKISGAASDVIG